MFCRLWLLLAECNTKIRLNIAVNIFAAMFIFVLHASSRPNIKDVIGGIFAFEKDAEYIKWQYRQNMS